MTAATSVAVLQPAAGPAWPWPLDLGRYQRDGELTEAELTGLCALGLEQLRFDRDRKSAAWQSLRRLVRPLDDALTAAHWHPDNRHQRRFARDAAALVLLRCAELGRVYWAWPARDWADLIGDGTDGLRERLPGQIGTSARAYLLVYAYLLSGFTAFDLVGRFHRQALAWRAFGRDIVEEAIGPIRKVLTGWGYRANSLTSLVCTVLLLNRSPLLEDLSSDVLIRLRTDPAMQQHHHARDLHGIHRALAALGHAEPPPAPRYGDGPALITGADAAWSAWIERWYATSTLEPATRGIYRVVLAKIGRWLAAEHPDITGPGQWTRQTCAAWVATVDRLSVGDYSQSAAWSRGRRDHIGKPVTPKTKRGYLRIARTFFRDCQEWDWIPRRFDPARALATPRSIQALQGPDPRVIADDIWAKLLWAGLNLDNDDLPSTDGRAHPVEMVRAVTLTWLFSGQRSDEIARLRLGCVRWQHNGTPILSGSDQVLARDAVCLLDVPTHKTGTAFTKPVDPLLGQAIEAWQAVRPPQPAMLDRKTGDRVDFLFTIRAKRIGKTYINEKIIPILCRKAGAPIADVRGRITSHRARSTIATQLYNAKEPMTLFELQAWLGHRSPESTQHYAKITPNTLAKAYADAGYFERNVRTIEVLIDRDAVTAGQAATGEPWQYYDLGHGLCSYTFFEQCPHRMACAKCDFYTPKDSSKAQLLEAKANLQRTLTAIPLTDDERAAIDDGQAAMDKLLERLASVPTPAGPAPHQLGVPPTATRLPIIEITQPGSRS
ncbi:MAG: tyrosine-type recombinase/integrase [Micromonosporaceae bacterium]